MNKNKNLVSIIVNCFNSEKFLNKTLNNVDKQTCKNWELIFCDNQSKENNKKIFQSFKNIIILITPIFLLIKIMWFT